MNNQNGPTTALRYKTYLRQVRGIYQKPVAQTSTALILTLVTVAFFGFAAIRPTLATVSQLIKEIDQKKDIDQKLAQKIGALSSVQEEFLVAKDKLSLLDTAIHAGPNQNLLLLQLEYLAYKNATTIDSLRTDPMTAFSKSQEPPSKSTDAFPSFTIVMTVSAPDQLTHRKLLEDLNRLDRVLRVEAASFSRPEDKEDNTLKMTVTLRAYYQAPTPTKP